VTTHAVTSNADSAAVKLLEVREQSFWELLGDVGIHVVALIPRLLGRVDVETSTGSEIVRIVLALDLQASCLHSQVGEIIRYLHTHNILGLVSGYTTAMPFWLAPCWKKPFSEQLSPVQVNPDK
jgi:hypothetical protein